MHFVHYDAVAKKLAGDWWIAWVEGIPGTVRFRGHAAEELTIAGHIMAHEGLEEYRGIAISVEMQDQMGRPFGRGNHLGY